MLIPPATTLLSIPIPPVAPILHHVLRLLLLLLLLLLLIANLLILRLLRLLIHPIARRLAPLTLLLLRSRMPTPPAYLALILRHLDLPEDPRQARCTDADAAA